MTEAREAATREVDQLCHRYRSLTAELEAYDLDGEVATRLAALRAAVAGEVTNAEGLSAVRAALGRVFQHLTLVRHEGELLLVPQVREPVLAAGVDLVQPQPGRIAVPGKQEEETDVISPGTAKTSRPSSSAKSAVMSAPLRARASTTIVAAQRPATIRLRAGNRQGAGSTPGAYSETTGRSRAIRAASAACAAG